MSDATKREYIGNVFVDHGSVVVLDPMYADVSEKDQERFLEADTGAKIDCDDDGMPEGTDHIGVWVSTGTGDGRLREQSGGTLDAKLPYDKSRAVEEDVRRRALGGPDDRGDA